MIKGGYKIIDLKGKDLTLDVGMVYEGIYDALEGTTKAILLSGLVVNGVEYRDVFVGPIVDSGAYLIYYTHDNTHFDSWSGVIKIEDTDVVTAISK